MSHPDRVSTNSGFDLDFHIFFGCRNGKCEWTAGDTVTEKDLADQCEWCCIHLFFVHKFMWLCISICTEIDNARPSCSTGPSLSLSTTYITKAELSKQKIVETNKLMPCEAEYCNCTVRECVFSRWTNTVSVSLLCSLTSCYFIVIHTKSVSYFRKRFMKF